MRACVALQLSAGTRGAKMALSCALPASFPPEILSRKVTGPGFLNPYQQVCMNACIILRTLSASCFINILSRGREGGKERTRTQDSGNAETGGKERMLRQVRRRKC